MILFGKLSKNSKKVATLYALIQFFYYFNFFWLIQNIYFLDSGLDYKQLSLILGVWSLATIILEIPSGIVADKIGHKTVVVLGKLCFFLGLLSFALYPTFVGIFVGMLFWGIHDAFVSGALESLVYDSLKENSDHQQFEKVTSVATVSREVGLGVGVLIAGVVTSYGTTYNLAGALLSAAVGFLLTIGLPLPKKESKSTETSYLKYLSLSIQKIKDTKVLKEITFFTLSVLVTYQVISEHFIVSLERLDLSFVIIGIIAFCEMLFFTVGAMIASRISKSNTQRVYTSLGIVMVIAVLALTTANVWIVIPSWMLLRVIKAVAEIVSTAQWQASVESNIRATITSIRSFLGSIFYVPVAIMFGTIADRSGLFSAFNLIAGIVALYLVVQPVFRRRRKSIVAMKL